MLNAKERISIMKEAFRSLRRHYFINIMVIFIFGIVINGGYQYATNTSVSGNKAMRPSDVEGNTKVIQTAENLNKVVEKETQKNKGTEITTSDDSEEDLLTSTKRSNADIAISFIENIFHISIKTESTGTKYTKGVFSVFVNEISGSNSFIFGILNGVNKLVFGGKVASSVIIFVFSVLSFLAVIYIHNVLKVGKNRYYLEERRYTETHPSLLLFGYREGRMKNIVWVMFNRYLLQFLWDLTIIGGLIKHYEYLMIPYILAENPDTDLRKAFKLSKALMRGEKWNAFLLDLSLLPLDLLSLVSYNLSSLFFSNAYTECIYAELYMRLRAAKTESIDCAADVLNDFLLDISEPVKRAYPTDREHIDIPDKLQRATMRYDYMRNYSFSSIVLLFFTYSFVGWMWEVIYTLATEGVLANRGTMNGPWLPIYGVGGLLIILLLKPLREKPWVLYMASFTVCGIVEYIAAWGLEYFFHKKWWDYTGFFLNIHGRVCLEGLFVFGLAGVAFTYIFSPALDELYKKIAPKPKKLICTALLILFAIDLGLSIIHPNECAGVTTGSITNESAGVSAQSITDESACIQL